MALNAFHGQLDGFEDPSEYLEEVRFQVRTSHWDMSPEEKDDAARILFRRHFQDRAAKWYARLAPEVRKDWEALQEAFLTRFAIDPTVRAQRTAELRHAARRPFQRKGEDVKEYLERCKDIWVQLPPTDPLNHEFGRSVLGGLKEGLTRDNAVAEMNKQRDYTFPRAYQLALKAFPMNFL